jgi:hypothetical protein
MPQTPNSGGASYLSPADFLDRRDVRPVGELIIDDLDDATPAATYADMIGDPTVPGSPARRLMIALQTASGEVESALLRADRYNPQDLLDLQGNSLSYVQGIVAPIAFEVLRQRRGQDGYEALPEYAEAMKKLDRLADGSDTLGFVEAEAAGTAQIITMNPREIAKANPVTSCNVRIFGIRQAFRGRGGSDGGYYGCD